MGSDARPSTGAAPDEGGRTRSAALDLRPLGTLLSRIDEKYHPTQIWLFGSRARGNAGPLSDWDLFVVVPDETDEHDLDLRVAWRLQRGSGVVADVIPCRASDFLEARDTVNTLSYVVAHEGVLIRVPAPPPGGELTALLQKVDAVLGEAAARFGVDLTKPGAPASRPGPIR